MRIKNGGAVARCPGCDRDRPHWARGLCWSCYSVRRKAGTLPPLTRPARKRYAAAGLTTWDRWPGTRGAGRLDLHPDTSPTAIETAQRADVRAARKRLGKRATVVEVSQMTCLPVWNVTRHWE